MGSGHGDQRVSATTAHRKRMLIVVCVTSVVLVVQVVGGIVGNSLALLADSAHVATDILGVLLALIASYLATRPATPERTYGWFRVEIFAAVFNSVLLFIIAIWVFIQAYERILRPEEVSSGFVLIVALFGLVVNAFALKLLHAGQKESLNVRGAYLEVLGDLMGSAAVVIAAVAISFTGWNVIDPIASIVVGFMILPRAWNLLRQSLAILLENTPSNIDLSAVRRHILEVDGVLGVHDLHAWTITSGQPVLTAHVVVDETVLRDGGYVFLLGRLQECGHGDFDIAHSTFQIEPEGHAERESAAHE